jgi:hypothetical protein
LPEPPSPQKELPADDLALALIAGVLGVVLCASAERLIGLIVIALAGVIVAAARRAGAR